MVRIATVKKVESEKKRAVQHVRNTLVYPSAMIGLVSIIVGYGALIYRMFQGGNLPGIIIDSLVLLTVGIALAILQFLYHRYLFQKFPDYYAGRGKRTEQLRAKQLKKMEIVEKPKHRGRWLVPYVYLLAYSSAIGMIVFYALRLNPLSAFFLPLAGFHNVRFLLWRRKLGL